MITGINTDTKYKDTVYHVQTEEKEPLIETLVYKGGAILKKRSYDYIEKYGESLSPTEIRKLVEEHHKEMLEAIKNGLLEKSAEETQPKKPLSSEENNNTLDELLINYLTSSKTLK